MRKDWNREIEGGQRPHPTKEEDDAIYEAAPPPPPPLS